MERKNTIDELSALDPRELYQKTTADGFNVHYDFTDKELKAIDKLSKQINVLDSASLIGYGADAQTALANFSDKRLANCDTHALSIAGDDLTELVTILKTCDGTPESKNPIIRFFKGRKKELAEVQASFNSVLKNVDESEKILRTQHFNTLTVGVKEFDEMYDINLDYYRQLTMYIAAGKKRINELKLNDLPALLKKASQTASPLDAQAANDLAEAINSFESKLSYLQISRQLVIQQACQIRQLQKNYRVLAEQIVNILNNGIPTWKIQLRLALGVEDSKKSAIAVKAAMDFTDTVILKTAEALAQNTVETAQLANRPLTSIEVAQKSNDIFIASLEKTIEINIEGMKTVRESERILNEIEQKRNNALLSFSKRIQETAVENALGKTSYQPQTSKTMNGDNYLGMQTPSLSSAMEENDEEEYANVHSNNNGISTPILKL